MAKRKLIFKEKFQIKTTGGRDNKSGKWRGSYSVTLNTRDLKKKGIRPGDFIVLEGYDKE